MSYQKVIVSGNLSRDPEVRHTQNGATICTLSIPTTETWRNKSGEKQERVEWHRIVLWNKTAELAEKYLSKGSAVTIDGKLQQRKYEAKDGTEKQVTEIKADSLTFMRGSMAQSSGAARPPEAAERQTEAATFDDEIPF